MKHKKFLKSLSGNEEVIVTVRGNTLDSVNFDVILVGSLRSILLQIDHSYLYMTLKEFMYNQKTQLLCNYYDIFKEIIEDISELDFYEFEIVFDGSDKKIDLLKLIPKT